MVKMYTAITDQIDDPEAAVKEILEQLEPEKNMLKNTVGVTAFFSECGENGVYQAVAAALPFETAGIGSTFTGSRGHTGEYSLVITMLTSDDVSFVPRSITAENKSREEVLGEVKKTYEDFLEKGKPRLVLSYMPVQPNITGDDLVDAANAMADELPLFGAAGWSIDEDSAKNYVAFGGKVSPYLVGFIALYGNFEPKFRVVVSLDYKALANETAVITSSEGPVLKTVNNIPALDYLKKIEIVDESVSGMENSSLFGIAANVIRGNGVYTARGIAQSVRGDPKSLLALGNMPLGAKISFDLMDSKRTIGSALELTQEFASEEVRNSLNYSCVARCLAVGAQFLVESKAFAAYYQEMAQKDIEANYLFCYGGGEICPIPDKDGKLVNCLHNFTLVSCIFE